MGPGAAEPSLSPLYADRQLTFSVVVITETETAAAADSEVRSGGGKRERKGSKVGFSSPEKEHDSLGEYCAGEGGTEGKMLVNMESGVRWPKSVWDGTTTGGRGRVKKNGERERS